MAKNQLPKRIYVKREVGVHGIDEPWLNANETPDSLEEGDRVGIYELRETKTMKVSRQLT